MMLLTSLQVMMLNHLPQLADKHSFSLNDIRVQIVSQCMLMNINT